MGIKNLFFKSLLSLVFIDGFQLAFGSLHHLVCLNKDFRYIQNKFSDYEKLALSTDHDLKEGLLYFRQLIKKPTEKNKDIIWLFCDLLTSIYDSQKSIQNFSLYVEGLTQCSDEKLHHIESVKNLLTKIRYISVLEKVQENRHLIKQCFIINSPKNYGSFYYKTRDLDLKNLRKILKSPKFDLYNFSKEKFSFLEKKKKYINNMLVHMDFLLKDEEKTFHESKINLESWDTQDSFFSHGEKILNLVKIDEKNHQSKSLEH